MELASGPALLRETQRERPLIGAGAMVLVAGEELHLPLSSSAAPSVSPSPSPSLCRQLPVLMVWTLTSSFALSFSHPVFPFQVTPTPSLSLCVPRLTLSPLRRPFYFSILKHLSLYSPSLLFIFLSLSYRRSLM